MGMKGPEAEEDKNTISIQWVESRPTVIHSHSSYMYSCVSVTKGTETYVAKISIEVIAEKDQRRKGKKKRSSHHSQVFITDASRRGERGQWRETSKKKEITGGKTKKGEGDLVANKKGKRNITF